MASTRTASDEFTVEENQDELTLRGVDFRNSRASEASYQAGNESLEPQSQSPHDDLFLNLARADTAAQKEPDSSHRNQRRRVRGDFFFSGQLYQSINIEILDPRIASVELLGHANVRFLAVSP